MRAPTFAGDGHQIEVVKLRIRFQCAQPAFLHPGVGVMIWQVAYVATGQNQEGDTFPVRRAGRAGQCLVMVLNIAGQAKGRSNGLLLREACVIQRGIVGVKSGCPTAQ